MNLQTALLLAACCLLIACSHVGHQSPATLGSDPLGELQRRAAKYNSVIRVPEFETTPDALTNAVLQAITTANAGFDAVGRLTAAEVSFASTVRAMDDILYEAGLTVNRLGLIKETSTNAAMRDAATEAMKKYEDWAVGLDYREDVYRAVKSFAAKNPPLTGEDKRLLEDILRGYRRAGLELPKPQRDEVEQLRKDLAKLITDFDTNITKTKQAVKFTQAELEGVPASFLQQDGIKTGADEYTVMANITFHFITLMENAKSEATRKKIMAIHNNLARAENVPLLQKILELRDTIARKLGYASWADYQVEPKMAKTSANARDFMERLVTGLQPKFDAELEEFRKLKVKETGEAGAKIHVWDWRYFANVLKKEKYTVDAEQLRVFFPYENVLKGMFRIYEQIFRLKIERLEPPYKWADDLQLYSVSDSATGEPLGLFYLDMFPRDGKYNHFAQFGIIEGKQLADGRYQRPTVALICNFPPPQKDKPSLLSHDDVETVFHEFGHALHSILTRAKHARFAGTSVPRDFVEAPSQMLENWVWDKTVLDTFAADYRDPAKKIPAEIMSQLKAARLATIGSHYRRQLSFGLLDMTLHSDVSAANKKDCVKVSNEILTRVFLPVPEDTAFVAYFGHLTGYDAGYYGYAWADAIAADMATVFEKSPKGFLDASAGMRLRKEIYEPGDSRDVNESIEKFLGRPRAIEPFLKHIGIGGK
ncbi:MAG: Zn-dependent oligopeptidase [Verrucomicrobia bacterium]|nr:Zn-dependent oligopeptidase [Verrucomicrobiota bacterium]